MSKSAIFSNDSRWYLSLCRLGQWLPVIVAIIVIVINLIVNLLLIARFSNIAQLYIATNVPLWLNDWILKPLIVGYFIWVRGAIDHLFSGLARKDIFETPGHPNQQMTRLHKSFQNYWTYGGLAVISLIFVYIHANLQLHDNSWISSHPAIVWFRAPLQFLIIYPLALLL